MTCYGVSGFFFFSFSIGQVVVFGCKWAVRIDGHGLVRLGLREETVWVQTLALWTVNLVARSVRELIF
jgi:hypothetical protein